MKLSALIIILTAAFSASCARQDSKRASVVAGANARSTPAVSPGSTPAQRIDYIPDQFGEDIANTHNIEYTGESSLSYRGYEVEKRFRKSDHETEIEYAVLKRNGRVIVRFDDDRLDHLSEVRFGLCNFLNEEHRQLVVEQTANKFWRYWVLHLAPKVEVIYDSGRYDLVYPLGSIDLDGDGRLEIVQNLGSFWYRMGDNVTSPRPEMIFKYDGGARRYVFANREFQAVALRDIGQRIEKVRELRENNQPGVTEHYHAAGVADIVIRYLYAGRKREAWNFFEREYEDSDYKQSARATLKEVLGEDALYREIVRRRRRQQRAR